MYYPASQIMLRFRELRSKEGELFFQWKLWTLSFWWRKFSLCTLVLNWILETGLGEVRKNSFIALPGKQGHSRLVPSKTVSQPGAGLGEFSEEFYSSDSRVELLIRIRVCRACRWSPDELLQVSKLRPSLERILTSSICWGFSFYKRVQRYCYGHSLRGIRTLSQGHTTVPWPLPLCRCIPSLPWLANIWKASVPRSPTGSSSISELHG